MWTVSNYDDSSVKLICGDCNSPVAKASYNYFRKMNYESGPKVWCKVFYDDEAPAAFYYASRCREHVRLIEIAVRKKWQKTGLGKKVLYDLLARMKNAGITKLTFRTPIKEDAQGFWLHMGARIVDVKGEDYEMELTIK